MNEHEPGTLPYITKKWDPVTGDVDRAHVKEMMSWALEAEARFMRNDKSDSAVGESLKYVFPIIRRTVKTLTAGGTVLNDEISPGVVREITAESAQLVFEASREGMCASRQNALDAVHQAIIDSDLIDEVSGRIHSSIVSFPG
jgi:hypothetical protein